MKIETELKAFRLPSDVVEAIKLRAAGVRSETDVVIELLRSALAGNVSKASKRAHVAAQARKAADPLAQNLGRDDIDYMNPDELPSGGSVGVSLDAVGVSPQSARGKVSMETWRAGRKPLPKPSARK